MHDNYIRMTMSTPVSEPIASCSTASNNRPNVEALLEENIDLSSISAYNPVTDGSNTSNVSNEIAPEHLDSNETISNMSSAADTTVTVALDDGIAVVSIMPDAK